MQKASENLYSTLKGLVLLIAAILVTGCISAKSNPDDTAVSAAPAPTEEVIVPVEPVVVEQAADPEPTELAFWTVVVGENLWNIAAVEEVYNVPQQWPLIYKENLDQINDADLIYPGQILAIPRDASQSELDAAVSHAKNRGAWELGPIEASDREYLKNSG